MKKLYLVRHAKAMVGNRDFERPLEERGLKEAPFMGKLLRDLQIKPNLIISSPALRTLETAKLFAKELSYPEKDILEDKKIYEASVEDLMGVLLQIDPLAESVILVGHNPGITNFANYLSKEAVQEMPTSSVFGISFEANTWAEIKKGKGRNILFEYPKKYL